MTKLYEATVTVRIRVEENDEGNALLRADEVAQELAAAMPTGATFARGDGWSDEIAATLKRI